MTRQLSNRAQQVGHEAVAKFNERGPSHEREYRCYYVITSIKSKESVEAEPSGWKTSKNAAKEEAARLALEHMKGWGE